MQAEQEPIERLVRLFGLQSAESRGLCDMWSVESGRGDEGVRLQRASSRSGPGRASIRSGCLASICVERV